MSEENNKKDSRLRTPADLFGRVTEKARADKSKEEGEQQKEENEENENKTIQ